VELGCGNFRWPAFGFVHRQQHRLAGATHAFGHGVIIGREPRDAIDQHQHHVSFGHGEFDLPAHQPRQLVAARGNAAGIDDDGRRVWCRRETVDAVARQPRIVGDQRVARAGEAVEQRGLADIGPSNEGEDGQQGYFSRGLVASR
jgi:hypothetical protein